MPTTNDEIVEFRDYARNTVSGVIAIIDAVYTIDDVKYVDAIEGDIIHYKSPYSNWQVVRKNEDT